MLFHKGVVILNHDSTLNLFFSKSNSPLHFIHHIVYQHELLLAIEEECLEYTFYYSLFSQELFKIHFTYQGLKFEYGVTSTDESFCRALNLIYMHFQIQVFNASVSFLTQIRTNIIQRTSGIQKIKHLWIYPDIISDTYL